MAPKNPDGTLSHLPRTLSTAPPPRPALNGPSNPTSKPPKTSSSTRSWPKPDLSPLQLNLNLGRSQTANFWPPLNSPTCHLPSHSRHHRQLFRLDEVVTPSPPLQPAGQAQHTSSITPPRLSRPSSK